MTWVGDDQSLLSKLAVLDDLSKIATALDDPTVTIDGIPVPDEVREVLRLIVDLSTSGSVTVVAHPEVITTQEAADLLGVSRPTVIRLLDRGEIPYFRLNHGKGSHRRLRLADVIESIRGRQDG